jgi:hypothetical protein
MQMIKESFEQYQDRPELNYSRLKHLLKSKHEFDLAGKPDYQKFRKPSSKAQDVGTLLHNMVLEPERMDRYIVKPDGLSFATKEGKAWRDDNSDKEIISSEDLHQAESLFWRLKNHSVLGKFANENKESHCEVTILGEVNGIPCKARLDSFIYPIICDLKTSRAETASEFLTQLIDLDYDLQAVFYQQIAKCPEFIWAVASTSAWVVWAIRLNDYPDIIRSGQDKLRFCLESMDSIQNYDRPAMPKKLEWIMRDQESNRD